MKINTPLFKIEIEWLMIITIIISIFSLNLRNYLSNFFICYIFILFHEMSHMFFGAIFGEEIDTLKLTISGVNVLFKEDILTCNIGKIRKLIIYWIITFIDFLIDIIIFCVLLHEWGDKDYNFRNIATLIIIVILFGK